MNGFSDVQTALQGRTQQECQRQERQPLTAARKVAASTAVANTVAQPATGRWALYCHRWNTRRALLTLTDAELRDVGLDYQQARREAAKPFWRE